MLGTLGALPARVPPWGWDPAVRAGEGEVGAGRQVRLACRRAMHAVSTKASITGDTSGLRVDDTTSHAHSRLSANHLSISTSRLRHCHSAPDDSPAPASAGPVTASGKPLHLRLTHSAFGQQQAAAGLGLWLLRRRRHSALASSPPAFSFIITHQHLLPPHHSPPGSRRFSLSFWGGGVMAVLLL